MQFSQSQYIEYVNKNYFLHFPIIHIPRLIFNSFSQWSNTKSTIAKYITETDDKGDGDDTDIVEKVQKLFDY